jgi:hypothetical protein
MTQTCFRRLNRYLDRELDRLGVAINEAEALDDAEDRRIAGLRIRCKLDQLRAKRETWFGPYPEVKGFGP